MIYRSHIIILLLLILQFQVSIHSQSNSVPGNSEFDDYYPKYVTGLNLYSHFRDYQLGDFNESIIEFSGEFGRSLNSSMVIGIRLNNTILFDKSRIVNSGGTNFRISLNPYFSYYVFNNLFLEASCGVGYGFNKFFNDSGGLLREWENMLIYRYHLAAGYDIYVTKNRSLAIRPMCYLMQRRMKTPQYEVMPKNSKETEAGISISFIINIFTP